MMAPPKKPPTENAMRLRLAKEWLPALDKAVKEDGCADRTELVKRLIFRRIEAILKPKKR